MVPPESSSSSSPSKHAGLTSKTMVDLPTGAAFLWAAISCGVSLGLDSSSSSSSPKRSQSSESSALAAALAGAAGAAPDAAPGRLAFCATLKEAMWQYQRAAYGNFAQSGQPPSALNSVMSAWDGTQ